MNAHPFDAIRCPSLGEKPRAVGLTSVLDKGLGAGEAADLAATAGAWIDVVKLGWGTSRLTPGEVLERKLKIYREAAIAPCTGGTFLELAHVQGQIEVFLAAARRVGFEIVEVSNGVLPLAEQQKLELIRRVREVGLRVYSEVGKKDADEDALLSDDDRIHAIEQELDAGAERVILEARESGTIGIYDRNGKPVEGLLRKIVERVGLERVIFEAPRKEQQVWMIRAFGPAVNLGNVPAAEALPLATLRTGLRGDTFADVHLSPLEVYGEVGLRGALAARTRGGVIVLVDALRASATIAAALAMGMAAVKPVATPAECVGEVTAGERDGRKLAHVRYGNSPTELMRADHRGKTLVLTTTNGVECLLAAAGPGSTVLICTSLNHSAVARAAMRFARERQCPSTLLMAGRRNREIIEDSLAAACILQALKPAAYHGKTLPPTDDLERQFREGDTGRNLIALGYGEDVGFCARIDVFDVVPVWRDGLLVPLETAGGKEDGGREGWRDAGILTSAFAPPVPPSLRPAVPLSHRKEDRA